MPLSDMFLGLALRDMFQGCEALGLDVTASNKGSKTETPRSLALFLLSMVHDVLRAAGSTSDSMVPSMAIPWPSTTG